MPIVLSAYGWLSYEKIEECHATLPLFSADQASWVGRHPQAGSEMKKRPAAPLKNETADRINRINRAGQSSAQPTAAWLCR
ncbi:MAG: hypothetical protein ACREBD_03035 [Blastocatellia bacterium]